MAGMVKNRNVVDFWTDQSSSSNSLYVNCGCTVRDSAVLGHYPSLIPLWSCSIDVFHLDAKGHRIADSELKKIRAKDQYQ